jgi:hypothetical protein
VVRRRLHADDPFLVDDDAVPTLVVMYYTAPSKPAQKRLSTAMLLASNTTTRRLTFMLRLLARRRCTVLQPLEEVEHCGAPAAGDGPDGRATCGIADVRSTSSW